MSFITALEDFFRDPKGFRKRLGQPKLDLDGILFMKMCKTLHAQAPDGSTHLIMDAAFADGSYSFSCRAGTKPHPKAAFTLSENAASQMGRMLDEVRDAMLKQRHPVWKSCILEVDVPADRYKVDFTY